MGTMRDMDKERLSRNPTVLITAIRTGRFAMHHKWGQHFESQSHRTDQGGSDYVGADDVLEQA